MENEEPAKNELQDILNSNEYRMYYEDSRNILEIWWDEAAAWLAEQLAKLFPAMTPTGGAAGNILIVLVCAVIIVLLFVLAVMISKRRRNSTLGTKQPFQTNHELEWTYKQHLAEAYKQEALDNYSLATRHMFLALLLYFHEKEWLAARIWKTNWEYYEELRKGKKESAELFFHFAVLFDQATYGEQEIDKEEYLSYRNEVIKWLEEKVDQSKNA